jgi:hypothetical protein
MSRKLTLKQVHALFKKEGYELLEDLYLGVNVALAFKCNAGHIHKMPVSSLRKGVRCAVCVGNRKISIQEIRDKFADEDYTLISEEYANNKSHLAYRCDKGHEHKMSYGKFKAGRRCPTCARDRHKGRKREKTSLSLAKKEFLSLGYSPLFTSFSGTHSPLPFKCSEGHTTTIRLKDLRSGSRCSYCAGNSRLSFEQVKEEFVKAGYTLVSTKYKNSRLPLDYLCSEGHNSAISLSNLRSGNKCPRCSSQLTSSKLKLSLEQVYKEFDKAGFKPLFKKYSSAHERLPFICEKGHKHSISISCLNNGVSCRFCSKSGSSRAEREIAEFCKELGNTLTNDRSVINPYELDIYFPEKKVAIEYCGLYWHSEVSGKKHRSYHYRKMMKCAEKGIRLITVFEDEYFLRREVVLSRIKNAVGESGNRVYARKCIVRSISTFQSAEFLDKYHLQGSTQAKVAYGIFSQDCMVGVMTGGSLTRKHVTREKTLELKRMCFLPDTVVVGGASKLFKRLIEYARNNRYNYIRSYQDMRYGNPHSPVYLQMGFKVISESKYTPHYVKGGKRHRNFSLRKTPEERLTGKTEWELRKAQGFDRIWDCGHRTYDYEL